MAATTTPPPCPVLSVRDLSVRFHTSRGVVQAVDGLDLDVWPGEVLGVVGESGCGKSVSMLSVLGLVPRPHGRVASGEILLDGRDLPGLRRRELRRLRGREMAMVFQDPQHSLNPVFSIGRQLRAVLQAHDSDLTAADAAERAVELLDLVGVPGARGRLDDFPHQWSGGMRQRAMIAMAIANRPRLLIADEPTTALDVTVQAQVLDVLRLVRRETGAAMILITHDLGLIAEMADRVVVMYAGRPVEQGPVHELFRHPRHPYTLGLLASVPRLDTDPVELAAIPGQPPSLIDPPPGCAFAPRCELRDGRQRCTAEIPRLVEHAPGHRAACHYSHDMPREVARVTARVGLDPTAPRPART